MKDLDESERVEFVEEKAKKRQEIQGQIQALADQRQDYIDGERTKLGKSAEQGLDEVIQSGLRSQAEEKGFKFDESE